MHCGMCQAAVAATGFNCYRCQTCGASSIDGGRTWSGGADPSPDDSNCALPKRPTARQLNDMQSAAVAEINRLTSEVTNLRQALAAEEAAHETDAKIGGRRAAEATHLRTALDEQTRFLAGINLHDHPLREQKERAAQVHRAMEILRPEGARVDIESMDAKLRRLDSRVLTHSYRHAAGCNHHQCWSGGEAMRGQPRCAGQWLEKAGR